MNIFFIWYYSYCKNVNMYVCIYKFFELSYGGCDFVWFSNKWLLFKGCYWYGKKYLIFMI